ncbi:MAG: hypothetical protein K2Q10_14615 [Rhodospirillales bacterium]|nr:hypothetical protein [Rhodospirillales bacterium]
MRIHLMVATVALTALIPAAHGGETLTDLAVNTRSLEITLNRLASGSPDQRLDEAERLLSDDAGTARKPGFPATDLLLLDRQWQDGSRFLEDRRLSRDDHDHTPR